MNDRQEEIREARRDVMRSRKALYEALVDHPEPHTDLPPADCECGADLKDGRWVREWCEPCEKRRDEA